MSMTTKTPSPVTDPRPEETASEYMDRMLGKPGSAERKIGNPTAYKHYLQIWDHWHAVRNPKEAEA